MENYGFKLEEEKELREVGGKARLWRHSATGAQLLSICNTDENKCFGVSFYTPPTDSTGVAHILEHSVLCGSAKYPVREPFAELLKGSLQTFLNAFTFPDKTCYPVASANLQDFYNLMDVYLDAVFHPLLSKNTFRQEGWHIDAESADGPWTFKGVVYNEMKGVYSSPDSVLAEKSQNSVFPDNLYCLDSGGNPEHIPDLTYQAFIDFHQRYYQPGNARFFFWGDDPEPERLKRIDAVIGGYSPVSDLPEIKLQKAPARVRYLESPYAAEPNADRAYLTLNWLLGERGDISESLKMEMLEHILEGLPGSPLRRALMESGLGDDTTGCGLETDLRQMYYSTGMKGVLQADTGKVEELVIKTLRQLVEKGIDKEAVEAAVNSVEFSYRENNSGRFPRGLAAMILSLSTWLYGGNPLAPLAWEAPLNQIKTDLASGKKIFEELIKKNFLQTPYSRLTLLPEGSLAETREKAETSRLAEIQAQTGPDARQQMVTETQLLQEAQLTPDKPEDLAKIPALKITDLPASGREIPSSISKAGNQTFIGHDLPTRGIGYATLLLPIQSLPAELVPVLPLFARSLTETGSAKSDYADLGMEIAAKTGGLGATILTGAHLTTRQPFCFLTVTGKAVYDKLPAMFDLMKEILLEPQNRPEILTKRLELMAREAKARLEYALQTAGHMAVSLRLGAHFSGEGALSEQMNGISQLEYLRDLLNRLTSDPDALAARVTQLRKLIIASDNAIFDYASEAANLDSFRKQAENLLGALPREAVPATGQQIATWPKMGDLIRAEAFITQGQVNYVGKGANLYDLGYTYTGAANVIMRWLRMGRLWEDIRVAGGAYGAFCSLDRINGTMICASYRDPNVERTLGVYDGLAAFIRKSPPAAPQLEQAIIGAIGMLDSYLLPDAKAATALGWYLSGQTREDRQKRREQILGTSTGDFLDFANVLEGFAQSGDICVLGGSRAAQAAKEHGWKEQKLIYRRQA